MNCGVPWGARPERAQRCGPALLALGLLAGAALAPPARAAGAPPPAYNSKAPLQFYEMARRQNRTDAACAETARAVERVIAQYGRAAPQCVPAWQLRLGDALWAAGAEREAIAAYGKLLALPPTAPVGEFGPYRDLPSYQREARLNQAILFARLGSAAESRQLLAALDPVTSRDRLLAAEARLLNRDRVADLLRDVRGDGHPERNWGGWYNPLRAAMLAHAAGEPQLAARYAAPIAARGEKAEKWPHWKSAWAQANQLARFEALGPLRTAGLRNGTYAGESTGFYFPLDVEIRVAGGALAGVRIVKHREDRPRNALDGFVRRLHGDAPLAVDAVTGATQTCHGVLLAVEDALRKAAPSGPAAPPKNP